MRRTHGRRLFAHPAAFIENHGTGDENANMHFLTSIT
jgi:hypothetical protein